MCRTRDQNQVTVEAALQDEAGTGDVWPECDDDDGPPPVLLREPTQLLCFTLGGGWIWDEAMQLEIRVRSGTELGHFWIIGAARVRQHDGRCPTLGLELEAEVVAGFSVSSEDEYRIGTAQLVDLWADIDGQPADDGCRQQHARQYCQSSDAPPSRGSTRLTSDAGLELTMSAYGTYGICAMGLVFGEPHAMEFAIIGIASHLHSGRGI